MKTTFYRLECLTYMHVGSSEVNYNIVDSEVEKDPVTGYPVIHASGLKGAVRATFAEEEADRLFGHGKDAYEHPGLYKFFDATLLARPLRVANSSSLASLPVVTVASVNRFLQLLDVFGCNPYGISAVPTPDFGDAEFVTNVDEAIEVEGERTGKLTEADKAVWAPLAAVLGGQFAIARNFDAYPLPVVARNTMYAGRNVVWYEEMVPQGTLMYFAVVAPDDAEPVVPELLQVGAHASVGCGYVRITAL
jgi:CRISPR-associated protein Cmr4